MVVMMMVRVMTMMTMMVMMMTMMMRMLSSSRTIFPGKLTSGRKTGCQLLNKRTSRRQKPTTKTLGAAPERKGTVVMLFNSLVLTTRDTGVPSLATKSPVAYPWYSSSFTREKKNVLLIRVPGMIRYVRVLYTWLWYSYTRTKYQW